MCSWYTHHTPTCWTPLQSLTQGSFHTCVKQFQALFGSIHILASVCTSHTIFIFMAFLYTLTAKSSTILNALWEGIGWRGGSWAATAISFSLINFRISYCKVTKEVCWVLSGASLHFQRFYRELLSLQCYIFIPIHVYPSLLLFSSIKAGNIHETLH